MYQIFMKLNMVWLISFKKDYELLKKCLKSGIQSAIVFKKAIVLKKFDSKLLYNEKYLKTKRYS